MKMIVSACLLGENCKYNGGNNFSEILADFLKGHEVIPVCPEVMGGLPIPREPAEIVNGVVQTKIERSVDEAFRRGAQMALDIALAQGVELAILQSRSPSCGSKEIYDGSFTGTKVKGRGIFAQVLVDNGIHILDIEDLEKGDIQ